MMFTRGDYLCRTIYWNGQKEWLICNTKHDRSYHVHLPFKKGNAARMIVIRADEGKIPDHYPNWMINDINRLWFGKDFETRKDLNNENLLTNEETVRVTHRKKKKKHFTKQPKVLIERKRGNG